ncbi:MAG: PPC domain-containing protein, partial [Anaerolineae bacterium]|nr:PPC domain-containing protein [Anaerolineae bacterium]
ADGGSPPPLVLLGPHGDAVGRPVRGDGPAQRIALTLPESGQYTLALGAGQGDYALTVALERAAGAPTATLPPSPTSPPAGMAIAIGQAASGVFDDPETFGLWAFEGAAGQTLTIRMDATTPDVEPVLRLLGPDGALLARDDNLGGARRAQIVGVVLPADGRYTLQTWGKGHRGGYALSLIEGLIPTETPPTPITATPTLGPTPLPSPTPTRVAAAMFGQQIAPGETVQGEITDAETPDRYAVFAPAGSILSLGMFAAENSPLVPALDVYAPDGDKLADAAGAPGDATAVISGLTLPATGAYILFAHGQPDAPLGGYVLSVGSGHALRLTGGYPAQIGQTYQGYLPRRGDQERWWFDLPANLTFSAQATLLDGAFTPAIEVIGPDGEPLAATRDNPDPSLLPPLAATLPGRYEVRVSARDNEGIGRYLITTALVSVSPTATFAPVSLDQTVTLRQGDTFEVSFGGVPGDVIRIEALAAPGSPFDPIIALYGPSGRRLARVDDSGASTNDATLQLALDDGIGQYRVQAYGYALMPGAFQLRVQLAAGP